METVWDNPEHVDKDAILKTKTNAWLTPALCALVEPKALCATHRVTIRALDE